MSGIVVTIERPTEAGRLYPKYDNDAEILAVGSTVERDWPYGVDIDGRIVFDLDDKRRLANFDLHIPRGKWRKADGVKTPSLLGPGDVVFSHQTVATKSFSLEIRVIRDTQSGNVHIQIGDRKAEQAFSLSASCLVLLAGTELVGFVIAGI